MPSTTTYEFEEIPVVMPNGAKVYCSGHFNISYTIQPPEPDVGIFRSYPEFDITDDWVTVRAFDDDSLGDDDMTIRLPWLPRVKPGPMDPLGQIADRINMRIEEKIMEIEDDE